MRIGLIDQDILYYPTQTFLNLDLMKVAAYYKNRGDIPQLILKPKQLEECDNIIIFKNIPNDKTFSTLTSKDNVKFFGLEFSDYKTEVIDTEIYNSYPYVDIYEDYFKEGLEKGFLVESRVRTLRNIDRIKLINGEETKKPLLTHPELVIYDNVVESDEITKMFVECAGIYSKIHLAYANAINTVEDFERYIQVINTLYNKYSKKLDPRKIEFLVNLSPRELYDCVSKYKEEITRSSFIHKLIWNTTPNKKYVLNGALAIERLCDTLAAVRIYAHFSLPWLKNEFYQPPDKIKKVYFNIGKIWYNSYRLKPIDFATFLRVGPRNNNRGVKPTRDIQRISKRFLAESMTKEVILENEAFFL